MKKIPAHYNKLKERHGSLLDAVEALGKAAKAAGPIDGMTAELIQLAAAVAIRSEGSVHSHTRRAMSHGASAEQVRHAAVLLTSVVGFPAVAASLTWIDDVIEEA
ncbi:MAG: carboxymuconolactone decarboxylase family protein [Candidatus Magnetominusculus sp. LBB02]|nr:carboxymuconolactone decarboxylase family protein [Candidatus Magnetominusculus sp. LBB02]